MHYSHTRDATGMPRQLMERRLELNEEPYICFVDFEKAFDRVNWQKLLEILKNRDVDWKDRRLIGNLYLNQSTVVRVNSRRSESCDIGQGVCQGCLLLPTLFSLYAEEMMLDAFYRKELGVKVGGKRITDGRFADDQAMIANTEKELQDILNLLNQSAKNYNMKINVDKTKVMCVSKQSKRLSIILDGKRIQQVQRFTHLGSIVTEDGYT